MSITSKIRLRGKRLDDAANDYVWLTDPELAELDAAPVPTTPFPQYLVDYTADLRYSSTSSITAIRAASPLRIPSFTIRV